MSKNDLNILKPSRREFLKATSALATAPAFAGIGNFMVAPQAFAGTGLAPGMTYGPTGFEGCERFQYNNTMSEGRALEGAKALKNKPEKLTILLTDGAIGQITEPFPVGKIGKFDFPAKGAPSVKEIWERETGIKLDIIGAPAGDIFKKGATFTQRAALAGACGCNAGTCSSYESAD